MFAGGTRRPGRLLVAGVCNITATSGVAALAGLLTLGACATTVETYGPPGKSQSQLDLEADLCDRQTARSPNHAAAYAQCMHVLHNGVRLPDGTVWPGEPQYVYTPPAYTPSPYVPSPYVPEQPQEDTPVAGFNRPPSPPPINGGSLTPQQAEIWEIAKADAKTAATHCAEGGAVALLLRQQTHMRRCFAEEWVEGMLHDVSIGELREAICSGPDILQTIPFVSPQRETDIVTRIGC